jgi:predicted flap endonuclease-1-like 5' DNA nuclease
VKGIGEKRATQLKALGISSVDDLSKASAKNVAKKLKISRKTVSKWIASAKELIK